MVMKENTLLRNYVKRVVVESKRKVLTEDDGGGSDYGFDGYGDYGGGGGGGMGGGQTSELGKIFVTPFVNLGKTVVGVTKIMLSKGFLVTQFMIRAFFTVLTPFFQTDYKDIFDQEKARTKKIVDKYQKVFDANRDAIFTDDMWLLSFLLNPSVALGVLSTKHATPLVVDGALSGIEQMTAQGLRGANTEGPNGEEIRGRIRGQRANSDIRRVGDGIRNFVASTTGTKTTARSTRLPYYGGDLEKSTLREYVAQQVTQQVAVPQAQPQTQLTPEKIKELTLALQQSAFWQAGHQEGLAVLKGTTDDIVNRVKTFTTPTSLADLERVIKAMKGNVSFSSLKEYKELQKMKQSLEQDKELSRNDHDQKKQELATAEGTLVSAIQNEYKNAQLSLLNKFKEHYRATPEAVALYDRAIQQLNSLKKSAPAI